MKKLFLTNALLIFFSMGICAQGSNSGAEKKQENGLGKSLIVFYTWSGNSRIIANELHTIIGGDIVEIIPAKPYTRDYNQMIEAAKQEIAEIDREKYPAVNNPVGNIADYDTVFIVYPLWWSHMASPMQTFLHNQSAKLRGKTLALICISASSGISQTVADARRLCPNSKFTEALHLYSSEIRGAKNQLIAWLEKTGLNRK